MKKTVFYSWQSDLPNSSNRGFIELALERATAAISADDTIEVEPVVDRDTLGVAGSPDISATIFKKIEEADVFVADVSIIGRLGNNRPVPNPNVLVELGYAIKALDYSRVILVCNTAYGPITDLPFDLRTRRVMAYNMAADTGEKAEERKRLSASLKEVIKGTLLLNKETPIIESPFEIALNAIENKQPNRIVKLRLALKELLLQLDAKAPLKFSANGTVDLLIKGIDSTVDWITTFARLCQIIAVMNDQDSALEVHKWFADIIKRYDLPHGFQGRYNENDFDYYKFLGHELYVVLVACLLKEERWPIIRKLVNEWIPIDIANFHRGQITATVEDVSKFVRSLYEEGEKMGKLSLQANVLREHFKNERLTEVLSFDDFMAADLLMFMVIELREEKQLEFYLWRPMSFLYMRDAPLFLMKARKVNYANLLSETCGIRNIQIFKERLSNRLHRIYQLFKNESHYRPLKPETLAIIGTISG